MYSHDSKPLLPYLPSPPTSRSSSPPPRSKRPLAAFFASKRRWVALLVFYTLVLVAWYGDLHGALYEQARSGGLIRKPEAGERVVYDAYGKAYPVRPIPEPSANTSSTSALPSTSLGAEADAVYHLFPPLDSPSPAVYLSTLEDFLIGHFPSSDTNTSDPHSLINALRSFFPSPAQQRTGGRQAAIPKRVWQTAPTQSYFRSKAELSREWERKNEGWEAVKQDNAQADAWVRKRFALSELKLEKRDAPVHTASGLQEQASGVGQKPLMQSASSRGVVAAWDKLVQPAVLRSDFWRYLVLAVEGGVYADTDVTVLKPVEQWGEDVSWEGKRPPSYLPPSLIFGVEADVGIRHDWHDWWPRPLQISQWTMASARGHPVLLDTVRRVVEMSLLPEETQPKSVMERTGPGPFTDAVLSYLFSSYRKPWGSLRGLSPDGWRFRASRDVPELLTLHSNTSEEASGEPERWGDVKVLSITGFSPGVGHMGSHDIDHKAAMAAHLFSGSWRTQKGADA
ncbi:hypothetical protein JCM11641_003426 [Rhodosporidiobolus odoratus]